MGSTATLFRRLWSCGICSRPRRSAISDVSLGLCTLTGAAEFRAPVLEELSEDWRLIVTTEAEEKELERDE